MLEEHVLDICYMLEEHTQHDIKEICAQLKGLRGYFSHTSQKIVISV